MLREKDQAGSIRSHGPGERKPIVQLQPIRFSQHQLSFKFCGNVYRMGIDVLYPKSHPFSDDLISSLQVLYRKDICCFFGHFVHSVRKTFVVVRRSLLDLIKTILKSESKTTIFFVVHWIWCKLNFHLLRSSK